MDNPILPNSPKSDNIDEESVAAAQKILEQPQGSSQTPQALSNTPTAQVPFTPIAPPNVSVVACTPKKRSFGLPIALTGVVIVIGCIVAATSIVGRSSRFDRQVTDSTTEFGYNSPIGYLPPFQEEKIRSGKFELITTGMDQEITKEGEFVVSESGDVSFKMISNIDKVNGLIEYLYEKEGSGQDNIPNLADEYMKVDFTTLLGYDFLYDPGRMFFGGFVPALEGAEGAAFSQSMGVLTDGCRTALDPLKKATSTENLTTATLGGTIIGDEEIGTISIPEEALRVPREASTTFLRTCFDTTKPGLVEYDDLIKNIEDRPLTSPLMNYSFGSNLWTLTYSDFDSFDFSIRVWDLSTEPKPEQKSTSFSRLANTYAQVYDFCRIPPTVTSDFMAGYNYTFSVEDESYRYPTEFDSGYFCSPSLTPEGYRAANSVVLKFPQEVELVAEGSSIEEIELIAEMRAYAEAQYRENSYYPDKAQVFGPLNYEEKYASLIETVAEKYQLDYKPLPENCGQKECQDFDLTYKVQNLTVTAYSYNHVK